MLSFRTEKTFRVQFFFLKEDMLGRISGGVSPDQATNLLDNALTSSDSGVILGALGAISSVPVAACRH